MKGIFDEVQNLVIVFVTSSDVPVKDFKGDKAEVVCPVVI